MTRPPIPAGREAILDELRRTTNTRAARQTDALAAQQQVAALTARIDDLVDALTATPREDAA